MKGDKLLLLWLAALLDEGLGDPANRWHPVAWLGIAIAKVESWIQGGDPRRDFWTGLGVWLGGLFSGRQCHKAACCSSG